MSEQTGSEPSGGAVEIVRCGSCSHTEDVETAEERWAAAYIGGEFKSWICEECWYDEPQPVALPKRQRRTA